MRAIDEVDEPQSCTVVLVQPHLARVVYTGELTECQSWLALNGDKVEDGHYEIRDDPTSRPLHRGRLRRDPSGT